MKLWKETLFHTFVFQSQLLPFKQEKVHTVQVAPGLFLRLWKLAELLDLWQQGSPRKARGWKGDGGTERDFRAKCVGYLVPISPENPTPRSYIPSKAIFLRFYSSMTRMCLWSSRLQLENQLLVPWLVQMADV